MRSLTIASTASFLEAIGASGYDRFNDGRKIDWLTSLHGIATLVAGLGFLLIPIAIIVLGVVLVRNRLNREVP